MNKDELLQKAWKQWHSKGGPEPTYPTIQFSKGFEYGWKYATELMKLGKNNNA